MFLCSFFSGAHYRPCRAAACHCPRASRRINNLPAVLKPNGILNLLASSWSRYSLMPSLRDNSFECAGRASRRGRRKHAAVWSIVHFLVLKFDFARHDGRGRSPSSQRHLDKLNAPVVVAYDA
jgi:hypothetical protein